MRVTVQKYGGSSVADTTKLGQVADRVVAAARDGRRVVVVVSAMGKTTDELLGLARAVCPSGPPRRELDMLLSAGERIAMALLAMALHERGLEAISFTGSQSGIMTNDRHSGARIIEVRPIRIEDELERGRVVIVAGFQGMSYKREITTLGRGGSDTTAVALAAALGADCEIYSDVDGVYSADPRVVADAHRLDAIGYEEMQELAEHGAKVLNAQAIEWAARQKITIFARATAGGNGQTVVGGVLATGAQVSAITGRRSVLHVVGGAGVLEILQEEGVSLRRADGKAVRLVRDDVPDWPRIAARLTDAGATLSEHGEVTLVGPHVGSNAKLVAEVLRLGAADVMSYDSAPLRLTLCVPDARVDELTIKLHQTFCHNS